MHIPTRVVESLESRRLLSTFALEPGFADAGDRPRVGTQSDVRSFYFVPNAYGTFFSDRSDRTLTVTFTDTLPDRLRLSLQRFLPSGEVDTSYDGDGTAVVDVGFTYRQRGAEPT
jgi:hypothetical protein